MKVFFKLPKILPPRFVVHIFDIISYENFFGRISSRYVISQFRFVREEDIFNELLMANVIEYYPYLYFHYNFRLL